MVLIEIGLLGERQTSDPPPDVDRTLYKITDYCFQIATRYGFPVLESLADHLAKGNHDKFLPRMKNWLENSPNTSTRKTLLEFDGLGTVDPEYNSPSRDFDEKADIQDQLGETEKVKEYISRFDEDISSNEIDNPEGEINTEDGMLRRLKEYRNPSQHGWGDKIVDFEEYNSNREQGIYRIPAVTVITLSSLAFWDGIKEDQFKDIRKHLSLSGGSYPNNPEKIRLSEWQPEDFYSRSTLSEFSINEN